MTKKTDIHFRTPYDGHHLRVVNEFKNPSRTKQEFRDECDPNHIVAAFTRTGNLDLINKSKGMFLDLTELPVSYQESLNLVIRAREAFDALPAARRAEFDNDVNQFLQTAYHDPDTAFRSIDPTYPPAQEPVQAPVPSSAPIVADPALEGPAAPPAPLPQATS